MKFPALSRFTPLGFLVFLTSAGITAYLWFQMELVWREYGSYWTLSPAGMNQSASVAAMAVGSFLMMVVRSPTSLRFTMLFKLLFLWLLMGTIRTPGLGEWAVVAVFLIEACLYEGAILGSIEAVVILASTLAVVAQAGLEARQRAADLLPEALFLALVIVVAALLVHYRERCVSQRQRLKQLDTAVERLSATNMGYQTYAHEAAAKSQVEERLRISRELHDIVGYTFTNNIMMMEAAITKIHKEPDRVRMLIDLARENAQMGYEKIRQALYLLRANEIQKTSSLERIRKMVRVFQVATQIEVTLRLNDFPVNVGDEVESFFYHFVQESLTNAFLHGAATQITVSLFATNRGLCASVADNGVGGAGFQEGIGLKGMRERLDPLHGALEIRTLDRGLELVVEVPYA